MIIIINTQNTCKQHLDLKICILIYIYMGLSRHLNVYIQKYMCPQAIIVHRYKIGSPAYIQQQQKKNGLQYTIRVPLSHLQLLLPQEEVVAHPHLPQAMVVEHPQDPPAPAAVVH
jgi:hypothetical protein